MDAFVDCRIIELADYRVKPARRDPSATTVPLCNLLVKTDVTLKYLVNTRDQDVFGIRRLDMKNGSLNSIVLGATVFVLLIVITTPAMAQAGGAQSRKPKPAVGAWWYKGDPQPPGPHPDLTGVWFGGSMNDIAKDTLPGEQLILTPHGAERYKNVDHAKDPNAQCLPPGPTRMTARAHPTMILQRPDVIAILSESEHIFRLIYTDGRDHPADAKDYPAWYGYSIGKWQGDTLVVDTVGVNERTWLDGAGHEHSDKLHLTERFRLADPDTLEFVVTYDDPVFFVKPFTSKKVLKRQIGDYIYDHACLENEKDLEHLVPTIGDDGRE